MRAHTILLDVTHRLLLVDDAAFYFSYLRPC
jgi:hypothetical protein